MSLAPSPRRSSSLGSSGPASSSSPRTSARPGRHAPGFRLPARVATRLQTLGPEAGQSTAEYAIATVAACGFGGVLYKVLTSGPVRGLVEGLIDKALSTL